MESDILKLGHHGSKTSSSMEFLKKVNPEVVIISAGEKHLQGQEDLWDAEIERKANEKKQLEEKQFSERSNILQDYGARLIDGSFVLDNVSYESSLVRETEDSIWNEMMLPKYKAIFDAKEAVRLANEKKLAQMEQMRTTIYNARIKEIVDIEFRSSDNTINLKGSGYITKDELIDLSEEDFNNFVATHNKIIADKKESDRKELELKERNQQRKNELYALGLTYNGSWYKYSDLTYSLDIINHEDEQWVEAVAQITFQIKELKETQETERQNKIKEQQELANKKSDAKYRRNLMIGWGVKRI